MISFEFYSAFKDRNESDSENITKLIRWPCNNGQVSCRIHWEVEGDAGAKENLIKS